MSTSATDEASLQPPRFWSNDWRWLVLGLLLGPGLVYAYNIAVSSHFLSPGWLVSHIQSDFWYYLVWLAFEAGFIITWLWLVLRYYFGKGLASLNLKPGSWRSDLRHSGSIALAILLASIIVGYISLYVLHFGSTGAIDRMTRNAATSQFFFFLSLGPTSWLVGAVREEFTRAMLLSRLWMLGSGRLYEWACIALSAVLFGLCHIYQGTSGILAATVIGVILGRYYQRLGRPWALIFAHGFFDTFGYLTKIGVYMHWHSIHHLH
jgi:membrane protease YdiL (CAAX protease family)